MAENKVYTAIGMMSGTSLDGIDVALIETDGVEFAESHAFQTYMYDDTVRNAIRAAFNAKEPNEATRRAEELVTQAHIEALAKFGIKADVVGFHGQTITHDPESRFTWQIGRAADVASACGMPVVADMRLNDVSEGGQGAPLLPLYHRALAAKLPKPLAVLNIGGVSNVTCIGLHEQDMLAFDTGPGNALINDAVKKHFGLEYDQDGKIAKMGRVVPAVVEELLRNPYFAKRPPKSLDRNAWDISPVNVLQAQDAVATLTEFTARAIYRATGHFPFRVERWLVTGGGRHNQTLMKSLKEKLSAPIDSVDSVGWNGDSMEAEGFAYLAVRSLKSLPLTMPGTTGVKRPTTGGKLYNP